METTKNVKIGRNRVWSFFEISVLMFLGVSGCSSGPAIQDYPPTANASEETQRYEADLNSARENQADVLSPHNFDRADRYLEDAQKSLSAGKDSQKTLHLVAEGRAYLDQANEVAKTAISRMGEVSDARKQAVAAGAPVLFATSFLDADNDLRDVTSDLEKNQTGNIEKARGKLQSEYLDLELKSIEKNALEQARKTVQQAKNEGADQFAPRTLAATQKSIDDAVAFIVAHRHDSDGVKAQSTDALKNADHLLKITQEAKITHKISPEDVALALEKEKNVADDAKDQLTTEQSAAKELQAKDESFENAQKEFDQDEAEVYRQGDELIIRLKGLKFPTNQANLGGTDFILLGKVKKVIGDLHADSVVVEGHTDSVGGKEFNDELSRERADAVREYLIANADLKPAEVIARGYGYQMPLASNKTKEGRAENRRVDVIIRPTGK